MAEGMPILEVERAAEQDAIANSLLGVDAEGNPFADDHVQPMSELEHAVFDAEPEAEQAEDAEQYEESDGAEQALDELAESVDAEQREQILNEILEEGEQQNQPVEPSPQDIQAGLQQLDQQVQELGLNDPGDTAQLAQVIGLGPDTDLGAFGNTMSKAVLSAVEMYQSGQIPQAIPPAAAQAFAYDFLKSQGVDPRNVQVDAQRLTTTMCNGMLNFIDTVNSMGLDAPLDRLNSPEMAQAFADELLQSLGGSGEVNRDFALRLADAGGKYILGVLGKLTQHQQARAEQPERSAPRRSSRSSGHRGTSRFKTNQDIFDDETMANLDRFGRS